MTDVRWAVEGVKVENIAHVWDDAWPYLKQAVDRFPQVRNKFDEGQVLRRLIKRTAQLWIGWSFEQDRVVGALLTEIETSKDHPDKLFMSIPLVGGEYWNEWGDSMWTLLKNWGVAQGCTHALGYGRKGWMRLYGFDEIGKTEDGLPIFIRRLTKDRANEQRRETDNHIHH